MMAASLLLSHIKGFWSSGSVGIETGHENRRTTFLKTKTFFFFVDFVVAIDKQDLCM